MMMFLSDETGAVTVDWVVLTAALVGLGLATMSVISNGAEDLSTDVRDEMTGYQISTSFDPSPRDGFREALRAVCTHSTGWDCGDGQDWATGALAGIDGMTYEALVAQRAVEQASYEQHLEKQVEFAAMLENFDPNAPDYSAFQGLWTTWQDPVYIEERFAFHGDGTPAEYATYLENYTDVKYQTVRVYDEAIAG